MGQASLFALRDSTKPSPHLSIWFDAFRGIAALAVLMGHARSLLLTTKYPASGKIFRLCQDLFDFLSAWPHEAVIVFFVMSGYLVGGPFLVRTVQSKASVSDYAAARISRMYTVLIPALVLTLVLDLLSLHFFSGQTFINAHADFFPHRPNLLDQLSPASFVCNAAFLQGISCDSYGSNLSLWSLSNEAIYYALWLSLIMAPSKIAYRFALPVLIGIVLLPIFISGSAQYSINYGVYFLVWVAGALAAAMKPAGKWPALASFFVFMLTYGLVWKFIGKQGLASDVVLSAAFIALIVTIDVWGIGFRFFHKPVQGLAAISYSLYAIHMPILVFAFVALGFTQRQPAKWLTLAVLILVTLFCVACAGVSWWLFESRTRHVKKWLLQLFRRGYFDRPATIE